MLTCPRCGSSNIDPLGQVRSALEWQQCRQCRHVWPERDRNAGSHNDASATSAVECSKCGRLDARVIGRSDEFVYLQCEACGHTSVRNSQ